MSESAPEVLNIYRKRHPICHVTNTNRLNIKSYYLFRQRFNSTVFKLQKDHLSDDKPNYCKQLSFRVIKNKIYFDISKIALYLLTKINLKPRLMFLDMIGNYWITIDFIFSSFTTIAPIYTKAT